MGVSFISVDQWLYTGKKTFPKIPKKSNGNFKKVLTFSKNACSKIQGGKIARRLGAWAGFPNLRIKSIALFF